MSTLAEIASRQWTWMEPDPPRRLYALRAGDEELARLRFEKECATCATGLCLGREWWFERSVFPHPRVSICDGPTREEVAVFDFNITGGGSVSFHDGARFAWKPRNIWSTKWDFFREKREIFCLEQQTGILKNSGGVTISAESVHLPELPVLILLAWYLRVLSYEHVANVIIASE